MRPTSSLVCAGCGATVPPDAPYPFRCPNSDSDNVDHVLQRHLDLRETRFPGGEEPNPFLRYRELLHSYRFGRLHGLEDEQLRAVIERLDARVAVVDGRGFEVTPFTRAAALSDELGFSQDGGVWIKDETGNVAGSHKARHLFGVLLQLEVNEQARVTDPLQRPELAIASCGNAALAAAVVAAAGRWTLHVFVPEDADAAVMERLASLGALITVCERHAGSVGDPTVLRLRQAIADGALPFTCQGDLNGLAIEGGHTLGWELAASRVALDRVVVQVGGGALASAVAGGLNEALRLGAIGHRPRIDTVQTESAWPLKRAYDNVCEHPGGLTYARAHRRSFMWPWETEPHSVAHGILDDETYDWAAVVEAMLSTGGRPVVVGEDLLEQANALARGSTDIPVDPTGSSGLAGLLELRTEGVVGDDERVAVLFTGLDRSTDIYARRRSHEEFSGTRHPVAQGI